VFERKSFRTLQRTISSEELSETTQRREIKQRAVFAGNIIVLEASKDGNEPITGMLKAENILDPSKSVFVPPFPDVSKAIDFLNKATATMKEHGRLDDLQKTKMAEVIQYVSRQRSTYVQRWKSFR
jgi:hypothetical protein